MVLNELAKIQIINILQFVIVLSIGVILTKIVTDAISNFLKKEDVRKIISNMGYDEPIIEFILVIVKYILYFITFIIALSQFGFAKFVLDIVIILVSLFLLIIVLFSLKDFIPNASAGIYLSTFKSISKGDLLKIGEYFGKVVNIDLVSVTLEDENGRLLIIPNSSVIKKEIIKIRKKKRKKKK
jgi:small conductance mechanosensitive channel